MTTAMSENLLSILSSMYDAPFDRNEREQREHLDKTSVTTVVSPTQTVPTQPPMVHEHHCYDETPTTTNSVSGISWLSDAPMARKIIAYRKHELLKKVAIHELHIALFTQICLQYKHYESKGGVPQDVMGRLLDDKNEITRLLKTFVTTSGSFFERALRDMVFLETQLQKHLSTESDGGACTSVLSHRGGGAR